jgi:hypothetical protein
MKEIEGLRTACSDRGITSNLLWAPAPGYPVGTVTVRICNRDTTHHNQLL